VGNVLTVEAANEEALRINRQPRIRSFKADPPAFNVTQHLKDYGGFIARCRGDDKGIVHRDGSAVFKNMDD
jgi:hypothetical protein